MKILDIKDQEDGSAIVQIELNEEENRMLVEYSINDILKKQIRKLKKEK